MYRQELLTCSKMQSRLFFIFLLCAPIMLHASFIESTMGTAVVNDATATYHNPAALTLFKKSQYIALGSVAKFNSHFTGQSMAHIQDPIQSGQAKTEANYYLPSIYFSTPIHDKFRLGIAVVSNMLNTNINETSILKYATTNTQIENLDFIPGLGILLNKYISIGIGFNYSYAHFTSNPIIGFPSLNIPDSQSHNVASGTSYGGNAGFVLKPVASTLIGFNYRSAVTYPLRGSSNFKGSPAIISRNYNFDFWTPARSVLTLSHYIRPDLGIIATIQRVEWSIFDTINYHSLATQIAGQSTIVPNLVVPYHFHDTWTFTVGGIKNITPKWTMRVAGTYDQATDNGIDQITKGDSMILGASFGYEIYKNVSLDGSYSHTFIKNQPINILSGNKMINGVNKCDGNAISFKLTINK